jgi:hypothetical protein
MPASKILSPGLVAWIILFLVIGRSGSGSSQELSKFGNPIYSISINKITIKAEVVKSPEKLWLGLSGRQELPEGTGMLFVMPSLNYQHFCMRDMLLPLDFIWIAHQKIIGLSKNISPLDPGTMSSPAPAKYVLEVPAGFCEQHGLKVNDPVRILP